MSQLSLIRSDIGHIYLDHAKITWSVEYHSSISIVESAEDERGVKCTDETIKANSTLFSIPFESIMTIAYLPDSQLYKSHPFLLKVQLREDDLLALLLLHEKYIVKDISKWDKHIKILPKRYYSIPNFSTEDLELIKGSNLYSIGKIWKNQIIGDFQDLCMTPILSIDNLMTTTIGEVFKEWLSFESYLWALSTIFSRFITISTSSGNLRGMVPVVDLLNHSSSSKVGHMFSASDGIFRVISQQEWNPGEEICLNYGHVSNERLLMMYGFSIEDNPYASINIYINTPSLSINKKDALDRLGIDTSVPFPVQGTILPSSLIICLRVLHSSEMESKSVSTLLMAASGPLSINSEKRACQTLHEVINDMISGYPESLEEDKRLLAGNSLTHIERHAITFRLSEKQVLAGALHLINGYINSL